MTSPKWMIFWKQRQSRVSGIPRTLLARLDLLSALTRLPSPICVANFKAVSPHTASQDSDSRRILGFTFCRYACFKVLFVGSGCQVWCTWFPRCGETSFRKDLDIWMSDEGGNLVFQVGSMLDSHHVIKGL